MRYTRMVAVACQNSNKIQLLDADANYTVYRTLDTGSRPLTVAVAINGDVWCTNNGTNTISRFKRTENNEQVTYTRIDYTVGDNPYGICVDYSNDVWVTCQGASTEFPHGAVYHLSRSNEYTEPVVYRCSATPGSITIDSKGNIFFVQIDADSDGDYVITRIDKASGYITTDSIITDESTDPIVACACGTDSLFVISRPASGTLGTLWRIPLEDEPDLNTEAFDTINIQAGVDPSALCVRPSSDIPGRSEVFVVNHTDNTVMWYRYGMTSGEAESKKFIDLSSYATNPQGISADSLGNIYVADAGSDTLIRLTYDDTLGVENYVATEAINLMGGLAPSSYGDMTGLQLMNIYNYRFLLVVNNDVLTFDQSQDKIVKIADNPTALTDSDFKTYGMYRLADMNPTALDNLRTTYHGSTLRVLMWSANEATDPHTYTMHLFGIPGNVFTYQTNDLNIDNIASIESVSVTSNITGTGNARLVVSVDQGASWYYYDENHGWSVLSNVESNAGNGMLYATVNQITANEWATLFALSPTHTLRWGYFISKNALDDQATIGEITMKLTMKGYWIEHNNGDVTYELRSPIDMRFIIKNDGSYRINYTILREPDIEDSTDNSSDGWMQESVTILSTDKVNGNDISASNPYVKIVQIPYTSDFRRREPYVLKYVSGTADLVRTAFTFDNTDASKFDVYEDGQWISASNSKYLVFDGTMKLKTNYSMNLGQGVQIDQSDPSAGRISTLNFKKNADGTITITNPNNGEDYTFNSIKSLSISPVV